MAESQFLQGQIAWYECEPFDMNAHLHWRLGYNMERDLTTQDGPRPDPRDTDNIS